MFIPKIVMDEVLKLINENNDWIHTEENIYCIRFNSLSIEIKKHYLNILFSEYEYLLTIKNKTENGNYDMLINAELVYQRDVKSPIQNTFYKACDNMFSRMQSLRFVRLGTYLGIEGLKEEYNKHRKNKNLSPSPNMFFPMESDNMDTEYYYIFK